MLFSVFSVMYICTYVCKRTLLPIYVNLNFPSIMCLHMLCFLSAHAHLCKSNIMFCFIDAPAFSRIIVGVVICRKNPMSAPLCAFVATDIHLAGCCFGQVCFQSDVDWQICKYILHGWPIISALIRSHLCDYRPSLLPTLKNRLATSSYHQH